ncbi:MAG: HD domain-containing protein [Desulfobacteraceae bacterium]|nr:HD domain-containing protein [Desulfobacteraceae bacterium]
MNPLDIIKRYYDSESLAFRVLMRHSRLVAEAAAEIAGRVPHLLPDAAFIYEAAMLHDIGILYTDAPEIGCFGKHPYVCHGYLGRKLLEKHGLSKHALVCERHVGGGLSAADIKDQGLDLPVRDMVPQTVEEKIICFADSFFSKTPSPEGSRRTVEEALQWCKSLGTEKAERFDTWLKTFGSPDQIMIRVQARPQNRSGI